MTSIFQRRHYAATAEIISRMPVSYRRQVAKRFASAFQENSKAFNPAKFIRACGLELSLKELFQLDPQDLHRDDRERIVVELRKRYTAMAGAS